MYICPPFQSILCSEQFRVSDGARNESLDSVSYICNFTSSALFLSNFSVSGWLCYKLTSPYPSGNESASCGLKGELYFHLLVTQALKQLISSPDLKKNLLAIFCKQHDSCSGILFLIFFLEFLSIVNISAGQISLDVSTSTLLVVSCRCFNLSPFEYLESALGPKADTIQKFNKYMVTSL